MANQRNITLRPGDATPKNIILRPLPLADTQVATIYLSPLESSTSNIRLNNPTLPYGGGGSGTAWTVTPSDSITMSDGQWKAAVSSQSDSISLSDAVAKSAGKPTSDTITISDSTSKAFQSSNADTITLTESPSKETGKPNSDTVTISDLQSKAAGIFRSDSISISDAIAKFLGLSESDSITLEDLISIPGSAVAYSFTLSDSIGISDTYIEVLVEGESVSVFPPQIDGFSVYYGGSVHQLCVVAESDAPTGMGGVLKILRNGVTYAIYLVDVTDPAASQLRIKTATSIKAIRLKT